MIVFDTCALLDIYSLNQESFNNIITYLSSIEKEIYLPYQVYKEYMRNYKECREKRNTDLNSFNKQYKDFFKDFEKKLNSLKKPYKKYETEMDNILNDFEINYNKFKNLAKKEIKSIKKDNTSNLSNNDPLYNFINNLFENQKPKDFKINEKIELAEKLEKRAKYKIGPGFTDLNKKNRNDKFAKCGDYFIWNQILNKLSLLNEDCIFITSENKKDWWDDKKNEIPCEILIQEFKELCPNNVFRIINTFDYFVKNINDLDLTAEIKGLYFLLKKLNDFKEEKIIFNSEMKDYILEKLDDSISDGLISEYYDDKYWDEICDIEFEFLSGLINDSNFEKSDRLFHIDGEVEIKCTGNATLKYNDYYQEDGKISFKIIFNVELDYYVNLLDENLENNLEIDEIYLGDTDLEYEILNYEPNNIEDNTICPNCGIDNKEFPDNYQDGYCLNCAGMNI